MILRIATNNFTNLRRYEVTVEHNGGHKRLCVHSKRIATGGEIEKSTKNRRTVIQILLVQDT